MEFYTDQYLETKESAIVPPIRREWRPYSPSQDSGGVAIAGAKDYASARRQAQVALDQYGYALTPGEQADLQRDKGGTGFMDGLFDFLEAPLNTVKWGFGLYGETPGKQGWDPGILGAIWSSDDDYITDKLPHLEGNDGEANMSMAAILRGSGMSPEGFGKKAGFATAGLALDVLLDPFSWISFGTLGLGRIAAKGAVEGAMKTSLDEVTQALVKGSTDGITDSLSKRLVREIQDKTVTVRDDLYDRVTKAMGDDLGAEEAAKIRTAVDQEVYMHEADRVGVLLGKTSQREYGDTIRQVAAGGGEDFVSPSSRLTRRNRWNDEIASIFDDTLDEGVSYASDYYNRLTQLVTDKQFKTLAKEFPEYVSSSYAPALSTGGVTLTTPLGRQNVSGIKLGFATDRAVTAPVRAVVSAVMDRLPSNGVVQRAVTGLWKRRGVEVAARKMASAGQAWQLSHAQGAARAALAGMNVKDAPVGLTQALRSITQAAKNAGEDEEAVTRAFGSLLDGELRVADLEASPLFGEEVTEALLGAHAVSKATLNTLHKALAEFDPSIGYIEDYFPLMASKPMSDLLDSLEDGARAIPVERITARAEALAAAGDEAAAARLRVGGQILALMSGSAQSAKAAGGKGQVVLDHSRFMNSRLLGKTLFSPWADGGLNLANKAEITRMLGSGAMPPDAVGWSSRVTLNDAVNDALKFMEDEGSIKLPKDGFDAFNMNVPEVLDSYVKATERVLNFKAFVRASEQVKLVRSADPRLEVGLTLANTVGRIDPQTRKLLEAWVGFVDGNRTKGLSDEMVELKVGNEVITLPKGMDEIPAVRDALKAARREFDLNKANHGAARDAAEKRIRELVDGGGLPREMAEELIALDSSAAVRQFISALWGAHADRVAALRSGARELSFGRSADEIETAMKELRQVERQWEKGIADAIVATQDAWATQMGYSRWKMETSVDLADHIDELGVTRGAALADMVQKILSRRVDDELAKMDPIQRQSLEVDNLDLDGKINVLETLAADDKAELMQTAGFRAFQQIQNMVTVSGATLADLVDEIGPHRTLNLASALAGFGTGPVVNDEMFGHVEKLAERFGKMAYQPRSVNSIAEVGDVEVAAAHYLDELTDVNPQALTAFEDLARVVQDQVRYLEEQGFEFRHMRGAPGYQSLGEMEAAVNSKSVLIMGSDIPQPPPLQAIRVQLGSGLDTSLAEAVTTLHVMLGNVPHHYPLDIVGTTNAWLSQLQTLPPDPDIRAAWTTLTRARRIATLHTGDVAPFKMDLVDPNMVSPFRVGDDMAARRAADQGTALSAAGIDEALDAGTGYAGSTRGKSTDPVLRDVDYESALEQGTLKKYEPGYAESQANKKRIESELDNDRRKFRLLWGKESMNEELMLANQLEKEMNVLAAARARLPVRMARIGDELPEGVAGPTMGKARILLTLGSGEQKVFSSMESARQWWSEQKPRILPSADDTGTAEVRNLDELPEPALGDEATDRYRSFLPGGSRSSLTERTRESDAIEFDDDIDQIVDDVNVEDSLPLDLDAYDAEAYTGVSPEAGIRDDSIRTPYARKAPEYEGRKSESNADIFQRRQANRLDEPIQFRLPIDDPEVVEMKGWKPKVKAEGGARSGVFEMADGSLSVFDDIDQYYAAIRQQQKYIAVSTQRIAEKTAKFVDKLAERGITLQGLLEEPPPGLWDAGLNHPMFTEDSWLGIVRAALKRQGEADPLKAADDLASAWRESATELTSRHGLDMMIESYSGSKFLVPGAGALNALRTGDVQMIAAQEAAIRRILSDAGMDPSRLLIERRGDGSLTVRWGAEKEFASMRLDDVGPALARALNDAGVETRGWNTRRMLAEVKLRGLRVPQFDDLMEQVGAKGNLPVDVENYFYLQELLSKVKVYAKAGRNDLMDAKGAAALEEILGPLEGVIKSRGRSGNIDALSAAWDTNRAALRKSLTDRDYLSLEGMVELAKRRKGFQAEVSNWERVLNENYYASTQEALQKLVDMKADIYQASSPYVRQYFGDVIESADYFSGRLTSLLSDGRGWKGKLSAIDGFEPHYNQVLADPDDVDEFIERLDNLREATSQVKKDIRALVGSTPRGVLAGEKQQFFDYLEKELADILPTDGDLDSWVLKRLEELNTKKRAWEHTPVTLNETDGFINAASIGLQSRELDGKIVDHNLALILESMASHVAAMWTPNGVKLVRDQVNAFFRYWKAATTVGRPTFVMRNILGGAFNGMIGDVGAREYAWVSNSALKIRNRLDRGETFEQALEILSPADADVFRAAAREGIFDTAFTSDLHLNAVTRKRSIKPWSPNFFLFDLGGRFMQRSEDFMRMAAFRRWYRADQAGSAGLAREVVNAVHFNYGDLTQLETKIKKWIPFYVWTRRNIPLQIQALFERPAIANRYQMIQQNVEGAFSEDDDPAHGLPVPDWMGSQSAVLGTMLHGLPGGGEEGVGPDWTRFIFSPDLPFKDFEQLLTAITERQFVGAVEYAGNMVNPLIKLPYEMWKNTQYETNVAAPMGMGQAFSVLDNFLPDLTPGGTNAETGTYEIPYWMRSMYETFVPFQREWMETLSIQQGDQRRARRLGVEASDGISMEERIRSTILSLARAGGVRGQTKEDVLQNQIRLEEAIDAIVSGAQAEGRILSDPEGRPLGREDLARIAGDPFENAGSGQRSGTRVRAIDGDTVVTEDGETIRLAFLNTAEVGQAQAQEAYVYLQEALQRGTLTIERTGKDIHGRTVAEVYVDGVNLSNALLGAGYGEYIPAVHELYQPNLVNP